MNEDLQLRVRFDVGTDVLEVNYTVTNKGGRTAYLLNRLFETKPDWKIQRHRVLVELEGADKVHLAKRIPDMPRNRPVLAPYCPYVTPVREGGQFQESFSVPLPIAPWWPPGYEPVPMRETPELRRFAQIDLRIDYHGSADGVSEEKWKIGDDEVIHPVFPSGRRPVFGVLRSEPHLATISVLDRRL